MQMSRKLRLKIAAIVIAAAASIVVMGVLLSGMQGELTRANYDAEMEREAEQLEALLAAADEENAQNRRIIEQNAATLRKNEEIMKKNAELIRELTKKLEAKK